MVDAPIPTVDFQDLQLSREAAHNEQGGGHCFVDLHDACDIVLAILETDFALIFSPVQIQHSFVNARQVLVDDPLATIQGLPHRDISKGVPGNHEVVDLAEGVNGVILVYVRNIRVIQSVLYVRQKVIVSRGHT